MLYRSCRVLWARRRPFASTVTCAATSTSSASFSSDAGTASRSPSPRALKHHLDRFVVGQERAKKVLSVAMFNHYLRVSEAQRQNAAAAAAIATPDHHHPGVYKPHAHPGQNTISSTGTNTIGQPSPRGSTSATTPSPSDVQAAADGTARPDRIAELAGSTPSSTLAPTPTQTSTASPVAKPASSPVPPTTIIEKSNVLLLGPTGVGKTLLAKTLADALDLPFSISDCTPFTQAGYIGEDADVCVARLLAAADYDVDRAEHGIIVLDEVDKLATRRVTGGRDVSGEGVQQALLKIIEGTTVTIQARPEKTARPTGGPPGSAGFPPGFGPLSPPSRPDSFSVRTDNILFIFTGAFIGLHSLILDRVSSSSIGFGATVRAGPADHAGNETVVTGTDDELAVLRRHVPFYQPPSSGQAGLDGRHAHNQPSVSSAHSSEAGANTGGDTDGDAVHLPFPDLSITTSDDRLNLLDLVTPTDLQKYGLIPELIGRVPVQAALGSLCHSALLRVLIEPQNSLISQYDALFRLSGIRLRFTRPALEEIATAALTLGTGARGLRSIVEAVLADAMFDAPGSDTSQVLVTREVAERNSPPICLSAKMAPAADEIVRREERDWERRWIEKHGVDRAIAAGLEPVATNVEQFRAREAVSGFA